MYFNTFLRNSFAIYFLKTRQIDPMHLGIQFRRNPDQGQQKLRKFGHTLGVQIGMKNR